MTKKLLVKRALMSALGVYGYIVLVVLFMSNAGKVFSHNQPEWLLASLGLMLFVVSACVTGTMVLLKPATMYLDGHKKEGLTLFAYTVASLAGIAFLVGLILLCSAFLV